jgi:hypothetical protein
MLPRTQTRFALVAASALALAACSDATAPQTLTPTAPRLSGGSSSGTGVDTTSGGGGGGGSTSGSDYVACGKLSATIQSYNIVVYTTRTGIGFSGTATNCGARKEAFEIDAIDTDPDPACTVDVPHFIAPKNTDPGMTITWQANSTLVPCQGKLHTFNLRLWDTRTGQTLDTATASAFL